MELSVCSLQLLVILLQTVYNSVPLLTRYALVICLLWRFLSQCLAVVLFFDSLCMSLHIWVFVVLVCRPLIVLRVLLRLCVCCVPGQWTSRSRFHRPQYCLSLIMILHLPPMMLILALALSTSCLGGPDLFLLFHNKHNINSIANGWKQATWITTTYTRSFSRPFLIIVAVVIVITQRARRVNHYGKQQKNKSTKEKAFSSHKKMIISLLHFGINQHTRSFCPSHHGLLMLHLKHISQQVWRYVSCMCYPSSNGIISWSKHCLCVATCVRKRMVYWLDIRPLRVFSVYPWLYRATR